MLLRIKAWFEKFNISLELKPCTYVGTHWLNPLLYKWRERLNPIGIL
jgi:hypothetical protein